MRFLLLILLAAPLAAQSPERLQYQNPGLTVDLAVGLWAWPLPMDYDGDGDLDLIVSSGGKPYEGTHFFENPGGSDKTPLFLPGRRVADYRTNVQISPGGEVSTPGAVYPDFRASGFEEPQKLPFATEDFFQTDGRIRANQWKLVDYDGDGDRDLLVGLGVWTDYGWDDAYNPRGEWTNGPLHGYVFVARRDGDGYATPERLPVETFGMPSPNLADFDGDGDLDLLCGEFLDGFTYWENIGSRTAPEYAAGRRLPIRMDLQMITPVSVDWDGDGDPDLVVGDEDGRVAFIENAGGAEFRPPVYFRQQAEYVQFGALVTPVAFDWDGDGDQDIVSGNTAGYIGFIENLGGGDPPKWAAPRRLEAGGETIRIQAGPNGSIQGPAEAKWGYTTLTVADWDADGLPDLVVNSIWGKVVWFRNVGSRAEPKLAAAQPVRTTEPRKPEWNWWDPSDGELVTQWRTTPVAVDWNKDGRMDLVMLDHEGYLAFFERTAEGPVLPGARIFFGADGRPLRLNDGRAGRSGRRKLSLVDWDADGDLDLLVNSTSANLLENVGENRFVDRGPLAEENLSGHTTSPTTADFDGDGRPDLLIGAEDGHFYLLRRAR